MVCRTLICDFSDQSANPHADTHITSAHCYGVTFYAKSNGYAASNHRDQRTTDHHTYRSNTDQCSSHSNTDIYSRCSGYGVYPTSRI